ncbi:DUF4157 domain-containing protein [Trichocoleus sp. DQ-U1]|uniref:eCIS core domain-containing protein n=1 Tax=Trichocoleus sp. DQ-U1 TaxID=2933926 RepID=UPI003297DCFC
MTYERMRKISSWNPASSQKNSHSIQSRPFAIQPKPDSQLPPTQQEIENQAFDQHKFEATGLEIQAKLGSITPEGQERLTVLQAKMDAFWQQKRESTQRQGINLLEIPNLFAPRQISTPQPIQAKLTIGEPGDRYEQEADRVAAQVVSQINNAPAPKQSASGETVQRDEMPQLDEEEKLQQKPEGSIQRQDTPQLDEEDELQMKPIVQRQSGADGMAATADLETSIQQAKGSGQSLSESIREPMEKAFGADFSSVKIHTDAQSHQLNQSIQAKAFTTGQDIFFRQGEYNPGSRGGQELLAHELTHVVQQNGGQVQRQIQKSSELSPGSQIMRLNDTQTGELPLIQAKEIMGVKAFQAATSVSFSRRPSELKKVDEALKKVQQAGTDSILLGELLEAIDRCLDKFSDLHPRRSGVISLRDQVIEQQTEISLKLQDNDQQAPAEGRSRSGAFSAEKQSVGKGSNFSDFDSKQYRVSGRSPNRIIEEVKRTQLGNGKVVYFAMGLVTGFNGKAPRVAPYPQPVSLGDWYPSVTHINGMQVAPKSGLLSAAALQESVNEALDAQDDAALGQNAIDVLYTYSAQRGGVVADLIDCLKGKVQVDDEATEKQEEIMLDAVRRKTRVTVSAHSRGTIKTDNAVRNVHEVLKQEYLLLARQDPAVLKIYQDFALFYQENDMGLGIDPEILAAAAREEAAKRMASDRAKEDLNTYIQLIFAGNAVQHPSSILKTDLYVGGFDPVSFAVGTYSHIGSRIDSALGTGGHAKSTVHSVGKTKGHGFVGNYVPAVSDKIAEDLSGREDIQDKQANQALSNIDPERLAELEQMGNNSRRRRGR